MPFSQGRAPKGGPKRHFGHASGERQAEWETSGNERLGAVVERRDAALRHLHRLNLWLAAGSVALTGIFADAAAHAFPGRTTKATSASRIKRSRTQTRPSSSTTLSLQPPAHAPKAANEHSSSTDSRSGSHASSPPPQVEAPASQAAPTQESAPTEKSAPTQEPTAAEASTASPESTPTEQSAPVVSGGS